MPMHRIRMLSMIEPEFPRHADESSIIRDEKSYANNLAIDTQSNQALDEVIRIEKERALEHSFIKRLFLKAARAVLRSPKFTETQVVLSKKI